MNMHFSLYLHKLLRDVQGINKSDQLLRIGGNGGNRIAERWVGETHFLQNHVKIFYLFVKCM